MKHRTRHVRQSVTKAVFILVTLMALVSLFFFHARSGSYSSVHGPVTELREVRHAQQVTVTGVVAAATCSVAVIRPDCLHPSPLLVVAHLRTSLSLRLVSMLTSALRC
jgi:hypothetical protein